MKIDPEDFITKQLDKILPRITTQAPINQVTRFCFSWAISKDIVLGAKGGGDERGRVSIGKELCSAMDGRESVQGWENPFHRKELGDEREVGQWLSSRPGWGVLRQGILYLEKMDKGKNSLSQLSRDVLLWVRWRDCFSEHWPWCFFLGSRPWMQWDRSLYFHLAECFLGWSALSQHLWRTQLCTMWHEKSLPSCRHQRGSCLTNPSYRGKGF